MTSIQPEISIIVPIYNSVSTLEACIQSIVDQDFQYWESILVDDGSSDNSYQFAVNLAQKDSRIKVLRQEHKGVSATRNLALSYAQGKHVCFVDADDTIETNYLSSLYTYREYDMVIGGYFVDCYDVDHKLTNRTPHLPYSITLTNITDRSVLAPLFMNGMIHINCNKLLNLEIIRKYKLCYKNYPVNEDYLFMVQYLMHTQSIATIQKTIYHWNRIENQKSGVNSMPSNLLSIYNEAHLLTRDYFKNNELADNILYYSYQFIILKYFSLVSEKKETSSVFNKLKEFHNNPLVQSSYLTYKPKNKGEKIIHEIQKRGYFKLYYFLRQTILK